MFLVFIHFVSNIIVWIVNLEKSWTIKENKTSLAHIDGM